MALIPDLTDGLHRHLSVAAVAEAELLWGFTPPSWSFCPGGGTWQPAWAEEALERIGQEQELSRLGRPCRHPERKVSAKALGQGCG